MKTKRIHWTNGVGYNNPNSLPIGFQGFEDYQFFISRATSKYMHPPPGSYVVSEQTSGAWIVYASNPEEAVLKAKEKLEGIGKVGLDYYLRRVKALLKLVNKEYEIPQDNS